MLFVIQREQGETQDPAAKQLFGELFDELLHALANPNHPINQNDNTKEIG